MKSSIRSWRSRVLWCAFGTILLGSLAYASAANTPQIASDQKGKVQGTIVSRNGDVVNVKEKKSGSLVAVLVTDSTKIERKHGKIEFFRHSDMDVTAMVPGLTIDAEGVGNAKGQLAASKITFTPDEFAIEVAEEQQITANRSAAAQAQSTANQGVKAAKVAQTSANQAQGSANRAGSEAQAAGSAAVLDAAAVEMVNKRVSDLADYKMVSPRQVSISRLVAPRWTTLLRPTSQRLLPARKGLRVT